MLFLVDEARPAYEADNLTAIYEPTTGEMWDSRHLNAL
jgi:hypothetical protein